MPPFPISLLRGTARGVAGRAGLPADVDVVGMAAARARGLGEVDVVAVVAGRARGLGEIDAVAAVAGHARGLGVKVGVLPEPPPPPPPPPSGAWGAVVWAQAIAAPAARTVVGEAQAVAAPAARAVVGPVGSAARAIAAPAQAVATPAARALAPAAQAMAAPAARVLAEHIPPPPPRVDAARSASARMARGSGGLVIPERLAERLGLPAGHHAAATPGIGVIVGLRDLAVGFLVITSLDDPLRLRAATALAAAVDAFDAAALAAPFGARRLVGGAALRGGALALHAADFWSRFLSSGQPGAADRRRVRQLPAPRSPRVTLPRS